MRFYLHGAVSPEAIVALERHGHKVHTDLELSADTDAPSSLQDHPRELLKLLVEKQWHLLTTDADFIGQIYEEKIEFPNGIIIHLLDDPEVLGDQAPAVDRLFERYKRLTPKRMYTITAHRVKIRQLPGMPE